MQIPDEKKQGIILNSGIVNKIQNADDQEIVETDSFTNFLSLLDADCFKFRNITNMASFYKNSYQEYQRYAKYKTIAIIFSVLSLVAMIVSFALQGIIPGAIFAVATCVSICVAYKYKENSQYSALTTVNAIANEYKLSLYNTCSKNLNYNLTIKDDKAKQDILNLQKRYFVNFLANVAMIPKLEAKNNDAILQELEAKKDGINDAILQELEAKKDRILAKLPESEAKKDGINDAIQSYKTQLAELSKFNSFQFGKVSEKNTITIKPENSNKSYIFSLDIIREIVGGYFKTKPTIGNITVFKDNTIQVDTGKGIIIPKIGVGIRIHQGNFKKDNEEKEESITPINIPIKISNPSGKSQLKLKSI